MNNTTGFTLAVATTATILGASGVLATTSAHADIRQEATTIGTESGVSTDVERYIGIQSNQYVLEIPSGAIVSSEEQIKLQILIDEMNNMISQNNFDVVNPNKESPMDRFQRAGGWRYWGNGVYTKGNKVKVDWSKAWHAVGNISYGTWAGSLGSFGQSVRPSRPMLPYPSY